MDGRIARLPMPILWKLLLAFAGLALLPIGGEALRDTVLFRRIVDRVGSRARSVLLVEFERQLGITAQDVADRIGRRTSELESGLEQLAGEARTRLLAPAPPPASSPRFQEADDGPAWATAGDSLLLRAGRGRGNPATAADTARALALGDHLEHFRESTQHLTAAYLWYSSGLLQMSPRVDPAGFVRTGGMPAEWELAARSSFPARLPPSSRPPDPRWTGAYEDRYYGGGSVLSCLVPIYDEGGELRAEAGLDWSLRPILADIVGSAPVRAILVDREGRLLTMTDGALEALGRDAAAAPAKPGVELGMALDPPHRELFDALLGTEGARLGPGPRPGWMISSRFVPRLGWRVLVAGRLEPRLAATEEIEAAVRAEFGRARRMFFFGAMVLALGVAVFAWLASRSFAKPLEALTRAARAAAAGEPPGPLPVERGDEFGHLARAFRDSAQAQRRRIEVMAAVHDVASATRWVVDRHETARRMAEVIGRSVGAERCRFLLREGTGGALVDVGGSGEPVGDGSRAMELAARVDDASGVRRPMADDATGEVLAGAALESDGERIGVLLAGRREGAFGEEERAALEACAGAASLVFRVARLVGVLEASGRELADANRQKSYFLQNLNHEIRTPLTAVTGWAEVLEDAEEMTPAQRRDALAQLTRSAKNLLMLVEDLLDLSRLESGSLAVRHEAVPVRPLVEDLFSTAEPGAAQKGVRLVRDRLDPNLPGDVWADPLRLRQVLWNLLDNAAKFTPDGGEIGLSVWREGDLWRFVVRDTGIGIPEEELPRIFERFRQGDGSISRRHRGIGVGLALARSLTELMGGQISVESRTGQGSRFTVTLPAAAPPEEESGDLVLFTPASAGVVEDRLEPLLSAEGWRIRGAAPMELLASAADSNPRAVVFDADAWGEDDLVAAAHSLRNHPRLRSVRLVGLAAATPASPRVEEALDVVLPRGVSAGALKFALGIG